MISGFLLRDIGGAISIVSRTGLAVLCCAVAAAAAQPVFWHDPGNVAALDLGGAAGSGVAAPKPPFTFLREDPSGTQPKVFVRDAAGATWNVKFGYEVHNESFCWRIVSACGYFAEPSFFIPAGRFEKFQAIRRATPSLHVDGEFRDARFQFRDPGLKFLTNRNWRWDRPPLAGTKELDGLKILIMLFSNWDNKDARVGAGGPNTALFEERGRLIYAFTDWGSGMGKWGSKAGSDSNWDCANYAAQSPEFVKGVEHGSVVFGWEGVINQSFRTGIPPAHVKWLMEYLGRITDQQLAAALKAAGANETETACFTKALRERIEELRKVQ
jgi:hypothetical protein